MQRPSSRLLTQFNIQQQFLNNNIKAVFNLQLPGEHPYCGDGLNPESGFTYQPEEFNKSGIFFFNHGWTDMTATDDKQLMHIMQHFQLIIQTRGEKLAVHCHAGTGRTGLAIAAWLMFGERMTYQEALSLFQTKRKGGLSKDFQKQSLKKFEEFLVSRRKSFDFKGSLAKLIESQELLSFGQDRTESKNIPILLVQLFKRLDNLMIERKIDQNQLCFSFFDLNRAEVFETQWGPQYETQIEQMKVLLDQMKWQFAQISDVRVFSALILDFIDNLQQPILNSNCIKVIQKNLLQRQTIYEMFVDFTNLQVFEKTSFHILNRFVKFGATYFKNLHQNIVRSFYLRLAIGFLRKKNDLDELFFARSFISEIPVINQFELNLVLDFLLKWHQEAVTFGGQANKMERIANRVYASLSHSNKQPTEKLHKNFKIVPVRQDVFLGDNIIVGGKGGIAQSRYDQMRENLEEHKE